MTWGWVIAAALCVGPIDCKWGDDNRQTLALIAAIKDKYESRCNQVEALIREAGVLIERALGDIVKYDDLNVEKFKLTIEFIEYFRTRSVELTEQDEKVNGDYWNGLVVEAQHAVEARQHSYNNNVAIAASLTSARTSYAQLFEFAHQRNLGETVFLNAAAARESAAAGEGQYSAQVAAAVSDAESQSARMKYEIKSRYFQKTHRQINDDIISLKLKEAMRSGGALNYVERLAHIGERAKNDYLEVRARLHAIALGLVEYYSIQGLSEVDLDDELKNTETTRTRIEDALKWLRRAANELARARMDEQECVIRLVVTKQENEGSLLEGLTTDTGRDVEFRYERVQNMDAAQLMGISATAVATEGDPWIDIEITAPAETLKTAPTVKLPAFTARLGRIRSTASSDVPDVAGGRIITNRSPIGQWNLKALGDDNGDKFDRLYLDFHLVIRAKPR